MSGRTLPPVVGGAPCQPSSVACGSQSKVSDAPASTWVVTLSGRKASSASSRVVFPAPPPSAATMTGTRPSMSTHSVAASSASSVPARSSSTMERGVGGTGRKAHPARWGVASAMGEDLRESDATSGGERRAGPKERQTVRPCSGARIEAWHSPSSRSPGPGPWPCHHVRPRAARSERTMVSAGTDERWIGARPIDG